jgi:hypothetical protein
MLTALRNQVESPLSQEVDAIRGNGCPEWDPHMVGLETD